MRFSPHLLVILHIKKAHIDYNRGSCEIKRDVQVARRLGWGNGARTTMHQELKI